MVYKWFALFTSPITPLYTTNNYYTVTILKHMPNCFCKVLSEMFLKGFNWKVSETLSFKHFSMVPFVMYMRGFNWNVSIEIFPEVFFSKCFQSIYAETFLYRGFALTLLKRFRLLFLKGSHWNVPEIFNLKYSPWSVSEKFIPKYFLKVYFIYKHYWKIFSGTFLKFCCRNVSERFPTKFL